MKLSRRATSATYFVLFAVSLIAGIVSVSVRPRWNVALVEFFFAAYVAMMWFLDMRNRR